MEPGYTYCDFCRRTKFHNAICYSMLYQDQILDRSFQRATSITQPSLGSIVPDYAYFPNMSAPQILVPAYAIANPQPIVSTAPSQQPSYHLPSYRSSLGNRNEIVARVPPPLQEALREVLGSIWWLENQLEPDDELWRFIFPESRTRFRCQANGCDSIFSRRDRAVNHFRSHIDHRPYSCNGQCEGIGCTLAFLSQRDLHSHISKPMQKCSRCDRTVTKRNLGRHQQSRKCRRASRARSSMSPH